MNKRIKNTVANSIDNPEVREALLTVFHHMMTVKAQNKGLKRLNNRINVLEKKLREAEAARQMWHRGFNNLRDKLLKLRQQNEAKPEQEKAA